MFILPLALSTLVFDALIPQAHAKKSTAYELTTATKTKKRLVEFEGHTMYMDLDAEVAASAGACTYGALPLGGPDLCPGSEQVSPWADYAEVEMSKAGGEILLSPALLTAAASADQSRDGCGWAESSSTVTASMNHGALATGSGMVAYATIQGTHTTQAEDSGDIDFSTNCLTSASALTDHETKQQVTTHIPFTLTDDALVSATIEHSELVGGSGNYDHVLGITVSLGGSTCELETDGTGIPQTCSMLLTLSPGDYSLTTQVTLEAWALADSVNEPSSSTTYVDYVSASVAARRL